VTIRVPIVQVIGIGPDTVAAQVAVGVVAQGAALGNGVLAQAVGGVTYAPLFGPTHAIPP